MYVIGGENFQPSGNTYYAMNNISVYDTVGGNWTYHTTTGTSPPNRLWHSATLSTFSSFLL